MRCAFDICKKKRTNTGFFGKRWETLRNCVERWLSLSGESKTIAETYKHCISID